MQYNSCYWIQTNNNYSKKKFKNTKYYNLKNFINRKVKYILNSDLKRDINDKHHISQCYNIQIYDNVEIIEHNNLNMRGLRDNGFIKQQIDNILNY